MDRSKLYTILTIVALTTAFLIAATPTQTTPTGARYDRNLAVQQVQAPSLPSWIVYSVPIVISNTQSVATPTPFQQMVAVNSFAFSSYEASNLQNVEFFNASGAGIPSWLESGANSLSTNTIYWLNLASGIPARSNITIYMGFASPTTNLFDNKTSGEAPLLSPVYGEYDNGPSVFSLYADFGGSALPSGWSLQGSSSFLASVGVETVNDKSNEEGAIVYGGSMTNENMVIESSTFYSGSADDQNIGFYSSGTPSGTGTGGGLAPYGYSATFNPWNGHSYLYLNGVSPLVTSDTFPSTSGYSFQQVAITPTSVSWNFISNSVSKYLIGVYSNTTTIYTYEGAISNSYGGLFFSSSTGSASSTQYLYWLRIRALPPNGVMPTVYGTAVAYDVTFSEIGLPSGATWSVTLGNETDVSSAQLVTFVEQNGVYDYNVSALSGYASNPSSGMVTVSGLPISVAISFSITPGGVIAPWAGLAINSIFGAAMTVGFEYYFKRFMVRSRALFSLTVGAILFLLGILLSITGTHFSILGFPDAIELCMVTGIFVMIAGLFIYIHGKS